MYDTIVNSQLTAVIVDNEHTNTATSTVICIGQAAKQAALIEDAKALLNVASLSHGNDTAVIADVQDAVLLENGAEHVLDVD